MSPSAIKRRRALQRRQARETIASQSTLIASQAVGLSRMTTACDMANGLLRDLSQKNEELRRGLDEAIRIAGQMSVLFPVTARQVNSKSRGYFDLPGRLSWDSPIAEQTTFKVNRLKMLLHRIDKEALHDAVHLRVKFDDKVLAYGLTDVSMQCVPPDILADRITHELGMALARELTEALR